MEKSFRLFVFISFAVVLYLPTIAQKGIHAAFPFLDRDYDYIDIDSTSMAKGVKMISYYLNKSDFENSENPPNAFKLLFRDSICVEYGVTYSEKYGYYVRNNEDGSIGFTNLQFEDRRTLTSYNENGTIRYISNYIENDDNPSKFDKDGWFLEFDEDGILKSEMFYVEGELMEKPTK